MLYFVGLGLDVESKYAALAAVLSQGLVVDTHFLTNDPKALDRALLHEHGLGVEDAVELVQVVRQSAGGCLCRRVA